MTVEDRVRSATRAVAETVQDVRPLVLPETQPAARPQRRRWRWMAPVMAAAAVTAVALTLVMVRGARNNQPVPPAAGSQGVPEYYVALNDASIHHAPHQVVVGDTVTGARLATISAPANSVFSGVTGAADDRTFVVGTEAYPYSSRQDAEPQTWYLLRLAPGTDHPAQMTRLPIPATPSGLDVAGMALSPDGSKFAVAVQPNPTISLGPETLRVYSVATGALLGTWTGPVSGSVSSIPVTEDDNVYLSWLADGHTVVFDYHNGSGAVRMLDTSRPGHDLIADSRPVPWSSSLQSSEPLVTSDGKTLASFTFGHGAFVEYSTVTGKLTRTLYRPAHVPGGEVLWASPSGDTLVGLLIPSGTVDDMTRSVAGVVTQGKFKPLSFPLSRGNPVPYSIAW